MEMKRREIVKGEEENLKWKGKRYEYESREPFFLFFKPLKFVWGVPKWKFLPGKNAFHVGEKFGKCDFASSEKYSSYATVYRHLLLGKFSNLRLQTWLCPWWCHCVLYMYVKQDWNTRAEHYQLSGKYSCDYKKTHLNACTCRNAFWCTVNINAIF